MNRKLYRRDLRIRQEIAKAKIIQENLIPKEKTFDYIKEFNLSFYYSPIDSVGGDIYDVIRLSENKFGFFIADVSGHGMSAALISSMMKIIINKYSKIDKPLSSIFYDINNDLYTLIGRISSFITAFYMTYDYDKGIIEYTDAGHPPALYYNKEKDTIYELTTKGTLFGIFKDQEFEHKSISVNKGDKILLYTDGLIEIPNFENEMFKLGNLKSAFLKTSQLKSKETLDVIIDCLKTFAGENYDDFDDKTMLCLDIDKVFRV